MRYVLQMHFANDPVRWFLKSSAVITIYPQEAHHFLSEKQAQVYARWVRPGWDNLNNIEAVKLDDVVKG